MTENLGKPTAKVIKKSVYYTHPVTGVPKCHIITTMEFTYPRIIHSELMTHRVFSRNAASSRAIPFNKMVEQLHGIPVRFGANKAGMQDSGEHNAKIRFYDEYWTPEEAWNIGKNNAVLMAQAYSDAGYHKQIFNRLTEPFQMMKTIVTSTEWDNFFWLRYDEAADPTLQALAEEALKTYLTVPGQVLLPGQWHLPFVDNDQDYNYYIFEENTQRDPTRLTLDQAQKVSAARCAAVSFRNVDYTLEKSLEVYERLVGAERKHASAFEHQATPIKEPEYVADGFSINIPSSNITWQEGISHVDRNGEFWSGNFKGWIQYRKLIPGENCTDFKYEETYDKLFSVNGNVLPRSTNS